MTGVSLPEVCGPEEVERSRSAPRCLALWRGPETERRPAADRLRLSRSLNWLYNSMSNCCLALNYIFSGSVSSLSVNVYAFPGLYSLKMRTFSSHFLVKRSKKNDKCQAVILRNIGIYEDLIETNQNAQWITAAQWFNMFLLKMKVKGWADVNTAPWISTRTKRGDYFSRH